MEFLSRSLVAELGRGISATVITATLIGAGSTAWAMQDAPAEPATDPASETTTDDPVATEESEVEAPPSTADAMGAGGPAITPPASTPAEGLADAIASAHVPDSNPCIAVLDGLHIEPDCWNGRHHFV